MKQLTDEVFTQVRDALRPFAEDARGIHPDWSKERRRVSLTQDKPLTVGDFRKANAALAALDTAQPALSGCACRWDAEDNRIATCTRHQGWLDVVQEWADRAKVAEAKLAQPSQADAQDAARYRWLAGHCRSTSEHWGGRWLIVVDGPAPKSHDSEDDFDAAIDAAIKAKERAAHGIKQGGQHD